MITNTDLDNALRYLDRGNDLRPSADGQRARLDLDRILGTAPTGNPTTPHREVQLAGRTQRIAIGTALIAAVTSAFIVLPPITGGDKAFASWTPTPHSLTGQERTAAADSCRRAMRDGAGADDKGKLETASVAVADRRGTWSTVVLANGGGFSATCITDDSSHLFGKDMIGSVGVAAHSAPGPRDLASTDLGTGSMNAGTISIAAGEAGADIRAITYRSKSHGKVTATVTDGHFALWMPGNELANAGSTGVPVDVTYLDGTVEPGRIPPLT